MRKPEKWACIPLSFVIGYLQSLILTMSKDLFLYRYIDNLLILPIYEA